MVNSAHREAARVMCVDSAHRILMMHWRDPVDGHLLWEPPGGGLEAGEQPLQAALRELREETGLEPDRLGEHSVVVPHDTMWKGKRRIGTETYFIGYFGVDRPELSGDGLLDYEVEELIESRWLPWHELAGLPHKVLPAAPVAVLRALDPAGPWAAQKNSSSSR